MIPDLSVLFLFKASVFKPADNVLHVGGCFLSSIKTAFLHILEIIKEGFEKSIFLNRKEHNFTVEFLKDQSSDISTDTKMQIGRNVVQGGSAECGKNHHGSWPQLPAASGFSVLV